jgi:hypothetical protein
MWLKEVVCNVVYWALSCLLDELLMERGYGLGNDRKMYELSYGAYGIWDTRW